MIAKGVDMLLTMLKSWIGIGNSEERCEILDVCRGSLKGRR